MTCAPLLAFPYPWRLPAGAHGKQPLVLLGVLILPQEFPDSVIQVWHQQWRVRHYLDRLLRHIRPECKDLQLPAFDLIFVDGVVALGDTSRVMAANVLSLAALKRLLNKIKELFSRGAELLDQAKDARYTSVPFWRPWRDF